MTQPPDRVREVPLPSGPSLEGQSLAHAELLRVRGSRELPVGREALTLPLLLLTVAALGGVRVSQTGALALLPPSLMSLILGVGLLGVLVRSGALVPARLVNDHRSALENASGAVVLAALVAASAQIFSMVTPSAGLLAFVFTVFFVLLLWNTLAVEPDRRQVLRSLLVVFGGALVLKYVVLAAIYEPDGGLLRRVLLTMLEGVSLGTLGFVPDGAATGYIAFFTLAMYFIALVLLPSRRG
jgi:phage shock protein PspC (stress-responsive transcriptional regulator)